MKAGLLPTFQKLVRGGASGTLVSTIPPSTSPAWPSMATGLNPGKMGVYSVVEHSRKKFHMAPVSSSVYRGESAWDYLSERGYQVALLKIPFLYPVYEINGCMVSGFGSASKFAAYPSYLGKKLVKGPSSFLEDRAFGLLKSLETDNEKKCTEYIDLLKTIVRKESKTVLELTRSLNADFFFYVVSPTDWLQHAFMDKILNLTAKLSSGNLNKLETIDKALIGFYRSIDSVVKELFEFIESYHDFIFLIVSDHGFTLRPYTFNLAKWLIRERYMKLNSLYLSNRRTLISRLLENKHILGNMFTRIMDRVLKLLPALENLRKKYRGTTISESVDFSRSKAFCLEDKGIYINPSETNVQEIAKQLVSGLQRYFNQFPDLALEVLSRDSIYWGKKVSLAPNLRIAVSDKEDVWEISIDPAKPMIFKPSLPGIHDRNGIILAYGPSIRNLAIGKVMIWDVCPTILYIFGIPKFPKLDGKILKQIFKKRFARADLGKANEI